MDDLWTPFLLHQIEGISPDQIKNLTSSVDQRLFSLISNSSGYVKY